MNRYLKDAILGAVIGAILAGCTALVVHPHIRVTPRHSGVDPKLKPYLDQFMGMAESAGVEFYSSVTMGFTDINENGVVGYSYSLLGIREIDVDQVYWNNCGDIKKSILMLHELAHAYCGRDHDYEDGKEYTLLAPSESGRYPDFCPLSLMYPQILDENCYLTHYSDYVKELFNRCKPI